MLYSSFSLVLYIFQSHLLLPSSLFSLDSHCSERNLRFRMGPPGLHSSLLLIFFSCFPSCTLRRWDVSIGPGHRRRMWAMVKQNGDKERARKKKTHGKNTARWRRKGQEGPVRFLITGALADPWPWSWPQRLAQGSEVVWKCQCGNSLQCWVMMILCSLPSLSDMISVARCPRLPRATHPSLTRLHKAH